MTATLTFGNNHSSTYKKDGFAYNFEATFNLTIISCDHSYSLFHIGLFLSRIQMNILLKSRWRWMETSIINLKEKAFFDSNITKIQTIFGRLLQTLTIPRIWYFRHCLIFLSNSSEIFDKKYFLYGANLKYTANIAHVYQPHICRKLHGQVDIFLLF